MRKALLASLVVAIACSSPAFAFPVIKDYLRQPISPAALMEFPGDGAGPRGPVTSFYGFNNSGAGVNGDCALGPIRRASAPGTAPFGACDPLQTDPTATSHRWNRSAAWDLTTTANTNQQPVISAANPFEGNQHLRIAQATNVAPALRFAFQPNRVSAASSPFTVTAWIDINLTGGADYEFRLQSPTQGFTVAIVHFYFADDDGDYYAGDILVADGPGGGVGGSFINTGVEYLAGQGYKQLRIVGDPSDTTAGPNGTMRYYYNKQLIYTGHFWACSTVTTTLCGTRADQVLIGSDNFQLGNGDRIDVDAISTVPEPATLALLGFGGLALIRRRR